MKNLNKLSKQELIDEVIRLRNSNEENSPFSESGEMFIDATDKKLDAVTSEESNHNYGSLLNQLNESEDRWQFAIEGNGDGLFDWNLETNEVFYSKQYKAILGFEDDEIENKLEEWEKRVHPEDKAAAYLDIQNHLEGKTESYNNKHRLMCKNGSYKWIEDRGKIISRTENNKPLRFIGFIRDITEQKIAEYHIQESEEKYRALFDNAPLSYQSLDEDGIFLDINPSWLRTLGYERDEVIGKFYADFLHPDWKAHFEKNFPAFKKRGYVNDVQFKIKHKKGHFIDISFEGCIGYLPDGSFKQTYCVFQDITERIQAEEKLQESEERYRLILENSMDAILLTAADGRILSANAAALKMFQQTESEICQLGRNGLVDMDDPRLSTLLAQRATTGKVVGELNMLRKEGIKFPVELSSSVFTDRNGEKLTSMIIRDITDRKRVEATLNESEEKFRLAFKTSPDSVNINRLEDGLYVDINDSFTQITGYTWEETIGKTSNEISIWTNNEDRIRLVTGLKKLGKVENLEAKFKLKNGRIIDGLMSAAVISIKNVPHILSITRDISDRKQVENSLKESGERLSLALEINSTGAWELDLIDLTSKRTLMHDQIFGYETLLPEWTFKMFLEHVIPEDRKKTEALFVKAIKTISDWNFKCRIQRPDGEIRWISAIGRHIVNSEGKPLFLSGVVQDITERKLAEEELKNITERLQFATEGSNMGTWHWNTITGELIWSSVMNQLFDIPQDEVMSYERFSQALHPDDRDKTDEAVKIALDNHSDFKTEYRCVWRDGSVHWCSALGRGYYDEMGKNIRMEGVVFDINDQKNAEKELAQHREHLEELIKARTAELEEKNKDLESFNKVFVGRELKMVELKEKIQELESKLK